MALRQNGKDGDDRQPDHRDRSARRGSQDRPGTPGLAWESLWPRGWCRAGLVALFIAAAHLDLFAGLTRGSTPVCWRLAVAFGALSWWNCGLPGPPTKRRSVGSSATAACCTGRWSRCRIAWRPGADDLMATAAVEAHRRREAERLAALSNKPAHPGLAILDKWAFRFVPILIPDCAGQPAAGASIVLIAAVTPAFPPPPPVVANLWIAPPVHTGKPPIYLDMPDHDKVCASRSAASSRASSTTCAAASRPSW